MGMPEKMLRKKDVLECTGYSDSQLYRQIHEGNFPRPKQISTNLVAWPASVVAEWQASLKESTIPPGPYPKRGAV